MGAPDRARRARAGNPSLDDAERGARPRRTPPGPRSGGPSTSRRARARLGPDLGGSGGSPRCAGRGATARAHRIRGGADRRPGGAVARRAAALDRAHRAGADAAPSGTATHAASREPLPVVGGGHRLPCGPPARWPRPACGGRLRARGGRAAVHAARDRRPRRARGCLAGGFRPNARRGQPVSQGRLVTRLAIRELWMTFRLLLVIVGFVGTSAFVVLLPAAPAITMERLAAGLGISTIVVAGVAGWSLADERTAGRAGWLVSRSVARGQVLAGWFWGLVTIAVAGLAGAGLLGWLAVYSLPASFDPATFLATLVAVAAAIAAAVAAGLLAGTVGRTWIAGLAAAAACLAFGILAWAVFPDQPLIPGGAYRLLAEIMTGQTQLAEALTSAGIGLALAALILVVARVSI